MGGRASLAAQGSPGRDTPYRAARWIAGALVLVAGAMHLWLYFDFFHRVHVVGPLFVANAALGLFAGIVLLLTDRQWALAAGIAYSAGTLAGFFWSVYHGLFGYVESLRRARSPSSCTAAATNSGARSTSHKG